MLSEGLRITGEEAERQSRAGRERHEERVQGVRGTDRDGWMEAEGVVGGTLKGQRGEHGVSGEAEADIKREKEGREVKHMRKRAWEARE